jgi:hypothetical protein
MLSLILVHFWLAFLFLIALAVAVLIGAFVFAAFSL